MKLALNGINLGPLILAVEEPRESLRDIGETSVAADGSTRVSRSRRKRDIAFRTVPLTDAEAHAWLCLLTGEGEAWSFDASLYGSKGTGPSTYTNTAQGAGVTKYGTGRLSVGATTGTITFSGVVENAWGGSTSWTVMFWRYEGTAWVHYVVRADGAKWLDGVRNDAASTLWLDVADGNVTIENTTGAAVLYDDLVVLPFAVLDTWPAQVHAAAAAYGSVPVARATGDMVTEAASREVLGVVEETSYMLTGAGVRKQLRAELVHR